MALLLLLLLPVCICIFTANLKSISCFAESGYNANIYVYLGQFHSRRMALPAFYWLPQNCVLRTVALLTFLWVPFPSSPPPSPLLLRLENDAKVLPLHATWRMRNIYLCQLSLIAVQCQLRCQFTFIPFPFIPLWHIPSVVFAMFTYVSFPSGLVEHIHPIWRPISALRFSERATNCRWDWQPVQLICLSVCLPLFLSASLLACHLSVCPSGSLVWPARREYLNCGIFVAFEVKVFAFDFGYKVDSTSPPFPPPLLLASYYLCENFACLPFRFPSLTLNASARISLTFECVQCVCPSVRVHRRVFACPSRAFGISICNI